MLKQNSTCVLQKTTSAVFCFGNLFEEKASVSLFVHSDWESSPQLGCSFVFLVDRANIHARGENQRTDLLRFIEKRWFDVRAVGHFSVIEVKKITKKEYSFKCHPDEPGSQLIAETQ